MTRQIVLPHEFTARPYQGRFMAAMDRGTRRACLVWHRRAGKDITSAHQLAKAAFQRVGLYLHLLPTQRQARKVVWDAITRKGQRLIDHVFPREIRSGDPNSTEMKIPLKSGSLYQAGGCDAFDSLMGTNPVGIIFSEYSLADPRAWDYFRPILVENEGFAVFIFTPRGYNHGFDMAEMAKNNPDWYFSHQTVDDTGVLTVEDIDEERRAGMPEELIQQEFYCSFSSANVGSVLGKEIENADKEGRICEVEWNRAGGPVIASLDLGFRDTTACWFWQLEVGGKANLIDYEEESGMDAEDWIELLKAKPYEYERVYLPHDAAAKTFQTKHSAEEQFHMALPTTVLPRGRVPDRINAARVVCPHVRFSKKRCERGLAALRAWAYKWDEVRKIFSREPEHNWASHGGDGFSYGAVVLARHMSKAKPVETPAPTLQGNNYVFTLEDLHRGRNEGLMRVRERV